MPDTPENWNMPAGAEAPAGIYVVQHSNPSHASPHQIYISEPMILPKCNGCDGVRFSFQRFVTQRIEDCEFFRAREAGQSS
jgi:hypothetical protein